MNSYNSPNVAFVGKQNRSFLLQSYVYQLFLLGKKAQSFRALVAAPNRSYRFGHILEMLSAIKSYWHARQMMNIALELQAGGKDSLNIYNPNYVTTEDKEKLLTKILSDYRAENPKAKSMSFTNIKNILLSRYKIESQSAGMFFRNQLKEYQTTGGNKNKAVVL